MKKKLKIAGQALFKILYFFLIFLIIFQPVMVYPVLAQEASLSAEPAPVPTAEPTPAASVVPSESPAPESSVAPTAVPSPESSPSPTPEISPAPTESPIPTAQPENSPSSSPAENTNQPNAPPAQSPSPEPSPEVTPAASSIPSSVHGSIEASVIRNHSAHLNQLDLNPTNASSASLTTDKSDYAPTDVAVISGTGFLPKTDYILIISSSDNPPVNFQTQVTTNHQGSFIYEYQLDGTYRPNYKVEVKDESGNLVAETTFTDSCTGACLDQYDDVGNDWQNGNLGSSNYREGDSVPYRILMGGLSTSGTHTLIIQWDITKSGTHAIDYITSFNRTVNPDPCEGVSGCGSPTTFAIPSDTAAVNQIAGEFTLYNGTITSVSSYTVTGATGDQSNQVAVTFTASNNHPVLAWGGHIASQIDWGIGNSAVNISGSPYHTRLISLDGSGGNQDRSLAASAILPTPGLATQISSATINLGQSVTDRAIYTEKNTCGNSNSSCGAVTGTTQFYVCGPGLETPCTSTANPVGSPVVNADNQAVSPTFTPTAVGTYCFAAYYTPDAAAQYSPINATITTNECVTVSVPQTGTIVINKTAIGGDETFGFAVSGPSSSTESIITSSGSGTTGNIIVNAGSGYSVTENTPLSSGWSQTNVSCSNGTTSVSNTDFAVSVGGTVTCTFTNTKQSTLKVIKEVISNNGGTAVPSDFTVHIKSGTSDVSGSPQAGSGTGTTYTLDSGAYTVSEEDPSGLGYTQTGIVCDGVQTDTITLVAGDNKTCTITNDDEAAHLIIIKQVIDDNGGTKIAGDFSGTITGVTVQGGQSWTGTVSPGIDKTLTSVGSYSVSENADSGYAATYSSDCAGTIALGQTKTCTITNDDIVPSLTLVKQVVNDNSGTRQSNDWSLYASMGSVGIGGLGPTVSSGLDFSAGTYILSESGPSGYSPSGWVCVGGTQNGDLITVDLGQSATCTITNNDQQGTLIVKKIVSNNFGGNKTASDFSFLVNNGNPQPFNSNGENDLTVNSGTYTITEEPAVGYSTTYDNCAEVFVPNGGSATCTITNSDIQPKLTVTKVVINEAGSTGQVSDFPLFVGETPVISGAQNGFNVGTYIVSETNQAGYTGVISGDCNPATGSVTLSVGDTKSCTITNTRNTGTIQVKKIVSPADNSEWDFEINGPTGNSVTLSNGALSGVYTSATGSYTITEAEHTGSDIGNYTSSYSCKDETGAEVASGSTVSASFGLVKGEDILCTFTNTIKPGTIIVTKYQDNNANGSQDNGESVLSGWTINLASQSGQVSQQTENGKTTFTSVLPGTYSLSENIQNGWFQSNISCTGDTGVDNDNSHDVTLLPGETVNCSIGNFQPGHIVVTKEVLDPDGNQVADNSTSFDFSVGAASAQLTDGQSNDFEVNPGVYTVTENLDINYDFAGCVSAPEGLPSANGIGVGVASGQRVLVTCTNRQKKAIVTVVKNVVASDGITDVSDTHTFAVTVDSAAKEFGEGANAVFTVNPGAYSASEQADLNYALLSNSSPVTVGSNGQATINIVNKQNPGIISGYKFKADGVTGIVDWVIDLWKNCAADFTGCVLGASITTDTSGFYSFSDLLTGNYRVEEASNLAYTPIGDIFHNVVINPATNSQNNNFSNFKNINITACKMVDADGDLETIDDQIAKVSWPVNLLVDGNVSDLQVTEDNGCYTWTNLGPNHDYGVSETVPSGWVNLTPALYDFGSSQDGVDQSYTFINFNLGQVSGKKYEDLNGNGQEDEGEPTIADWHIQLFSGSDGVLGSQVGDDQVTDQNGNYSFTDILAGEYFVCEVQQAGWKQTYPISAGNHNCNVVSISSGQEIIGADFGNQQQDPILTITKSNDKTGIDLTPGSSVLYTLTVEATQSAAQEVSVTDLLPKGFVFRGGSWKVVSSDTTRGANGDITSLLTAPVYHSPGIWNVGNIGAEETLTLTYIADIDGSKQPGLYKDLAWAKGETAKGSTVLALAQPEGFIDTNFVGTAVNVVRDQGASVGVNVENIEKRESEILGVSTSLPNTGAKIIWLILGGILFASGALSLAFGAIGRRKHD